MAKNKEPVEVIEMVCTGDNIPEINDDIPLPPPGSSGGRKPIWPWKVMEIGESFLMPEDRIATNSAVRAASRAGKGTGRKFATRSVEGGVRVWRVS